MALEMSNTNHRGIPINRYSLQCSKERVNSSKFRGVLLLKTGKWGATISHKYKSYWLGSYQAEEAAARAQDSAAIKLKKTVAFLNFPSANHIVQEGIFQSGYSDEEVVKLILEKTYLPKFTCFISYHFPTMGAQASNHDISCQFLFQKELTCSDVDHPSLLIPKKFAVEYFCPTVGINSVEGEDWGRNITLTFHDKHFLSWNFRYSYWKSTGSFLLSKGWGQFIKMYKLKPGDTVFFFRCSYPEVGDEEFYMIDVLHSNLEVPAYGRNVEQKMDVGEIVNNEGEVDNIMEKEATEGIKLFGVQIG
ncbi:AP2/ERF and B3 domain-containing transcription factor [Quillaja saponaria]|uniref:AP2/ERF and B3 domain-containing transcription factor n=1 Tax=Quillaja saponaria TaxID=32244 RepID=A0AAD7L7H3_QUISA|nr:AP2/ERF and B3 domain-containing transcription factor [Quillaja saponaria]